ncbi:MAG TPA: 3-hydroxyacyl-CoA dehydrogenase NAD-binding domain-containing protein [Oligoflexus sp.]|uniref:3-hydroxyacyl-CoA dehydrogenase NAD-binding domain-containing protein n=1 Tax=Oligoflexus sp. TaxID=1971216 RepID=UPI002D7E9E29|nr:3-hydroxyacyl-CoA dehydrogenase NAD-binding domain-containing protein [Oligoflexus sp.]HET9240304.1 3-hydroxyacyl-CoA dehydrogenase NAD-binding domain-containing protein [Oligoflexus sp.]
MNDIRLEKDSNQIVTLTFDAQGQSANTMNAAFRDSLRAVTQKIVADKANIKGILLTSAKSTFFAGGDLKELSQIGPEDADKVFAMVEGIKADLRTLETLGVPVVAAINGTALGGGWEIALACHHRLLLNDPKVRIGLPEVSLGLLPGGGGVVRMIRLLGLEQGMPLLMEGKQLAPDAALKMGLVHGLGNSTEDLNEKARQWILANPTSKQIFDQEGYKVPGGNAKTPKLAEMLPIVPAMLLDKTKGCYPAPEAILETAVESLHVDVDTALRIESRYFAKLATGQVAKNMISTFWFQLNAIKAGESRPKDFPKQKFQKVAVLGAGMMGAGIAYAAAKAGIEVYLKDVSIEAAEKGKQYSAKLLDGRLKKGQITEADKAAFLERIKPVDNYEALANCELVIEAVFEDRQVKKDVTEKTIAVLPKNAIMASNTSTLPITSLAKASPYQNQFIGLHFFSPVDKMQLVEIILGAETSPETLARSFDFVRQIDKIPIVVNDSRGFYTSRVFGLFTQEGIAMLAEGQAPMAIERAALQAGMPVGPLAVSDEVSLSLFDLVRKATEADLAKQGKPAPKHPANAVVDRMLHEFGRKGKAAGAGFYEYPKDGKKYIWPQLSSLYQGSPLPFQDLKDRLLFIQALETVRIYEEKVLMSVADANIGSIFGFGFAPWSGGTLQFINSYGVRAFTMRAHELAERYGERFTPPRLLIEKSERNEKF